MRNQMRVVQPRHFDQQAGSRLSLGMLSTLPPTLCGLATFTAALTSALAGAGHSVSCFRVEDTDDVQRMPTASLVAGSVQSRARIARELSQGDIAIVQHEFGIYGGPDGQEILDLVEDIDVPVIVVLHTVPSHPSANQLRILSGLAHVASAVVVLSGVAQRQLEALIGVRFNVRMIPHGAATRAPGEAKPMAHPHPLELLTWGLIGPGKGIENAIRAVGLARAQGVDIRYTIAGVTHPKVARTDGESYVASLRETAEASGVHDLVAFDHHYRGVEAMLPFIESAEAVVLPYESRDQRTSGVLVDSLAAGRPVIATAFPHAIELLGNGSGRVVEHGNVAELAAAMIATRDPATLDAMSARAMELAPQFAWSTVASEYVELCDELRVDHRMAI